MKKQENAKLKISIHLNIIMRCNSDRYGVKVISLIRKSDII